MEFREELLRIMEKNSRMNTKELAVLLGVSEEAAIKILSRNLGPSWAEVDGAKNSRSTHGGSAV